ncbi:phosphoadenosine phosphosulfate reductase domain-containing protein [Aeromonas veronii]|uniref:phosphoadenosine phosphosulfate reductase domain-containing protein n=1 Tax=Aeromonas veronii TaxID=654 RepID=UPI002B4A7497|nr:phosphoadenosine phosphosulfate reductase family protein [Aeromonas veronii]
MNRLIENAVAPMVGWLREGYSLCVSLSWGKDSTAVLVLVIEAMKRAKAAGITLPQCFAITSDTTVENPALGAFFEQMSSELERFCVLNELPLEYRLVTPPLTASFHYVTVGRGKLPRYPGMSRDCSKDWKINPIVKEKKALSRQFGNAIISLVGTRFSESEEREARMLARGDEAGVILTNPDGDLYAVPIADWDEVDVWTLLRKCDQRMGNPLITSFVRHFDDLVLLYKDANGGCVSGLADSQLNSSACGARFGCWSCVATGERDKSLQAMIENDHDQYGYLKPIADLRDWLFGVRWDMSAREWLGRTVDPVTGHIVLQPDYFSFKTRRQILRCMLSIDADECAWADEHNDGFPRFQLIQPWQLVIIDFIWSIYRDAPHAFSALYEYYQIHRCGRRYYPEQGQQAEKAPVPKRRWFKPPEGFAPPDGIGGLTDPLIIHAQRHAGIKQPTIKDRVTGVEKEIMDFDIVPEMEIDKSEALLWLEHFIDNPIAIECTGEDPAEAIKFYLHHRMVKVSHGQPASLDEIIQRSEMWARLQRKLNVPDIQAWAIENSISDEEHEAIKAFYPKSSRHNVIFMEAA